MVSQADTIHGLHFLSRVILTDNHSHITLTREPWLLFRRFGTSLKTYIPDIEYHAHTKALSYLCEIKGVPALEKIFNLYVLPGTIPLTRARAASTHNAKDFLPITHEYDSKAQTQLAIAFHK